MAFDNVPAGIRSWLMFTLQLYGTLQPDGGLSPAAAPSNNSLRYNQIQAIGTHNSYHVTPDEAILTLLNRSSTKALLGKQASEEIPAAWEATQAPLAMQLGDYGVRQIELDIYPDPQGGLFNTSAGRRLAGENGNLGDFIPQLNQPGWKVMHVPDIDMNVTCFTFRDCLAGVRNFSEANPTHEPIAIYLEFKTDDLSAYIGPTGAQLASVIISAAAAPGPDTYIRVRNITQSDVDDLHAEILSVFPPSAIITPDKLRGNATSLKDALVSNGGSGWPAVDDMRGKVLFVVINTFTKHYLAQFPGLQGALAFVSDITPTTDDVVFLEPANEKYARSGEVEAAAARVKKYAQAGYMVRVRSDYDTREARSDDTSRVQKLAAAGAHFISTDFPSPPTYFQSSYEVRLPTAFICNPVMTGTGLGDLASTLGTNASSSGTPSDGTPVCNSS